MIKNIAIFLAVGLALYLGVRQYLKHTVVPPFPAFEHPMTTLDEKLVNIKDSQSDYYLVSYFQTWCGDCVKEQPELLKLKQRFGDSIAILMVSDEGIEKITAFKARFNSQLDFYNSSKTLKSIDITRYPTTFLINKEGKTIDVRVEGINWFSNETIKTVSQLVKE